MNESLVQLLVGAGGLLSVVIIWKVATRKRRQRLAAERSAVRPCSLFGRVAVTAAVIVGLQWTVVATTPDNRALLLGVLGVPALFAAHAITKALTVTSIEAGRTRGARR